MVPICSRQVIVGFAMFKNRLVAYHGVLPSHSEWSATHLGELPQVLNEYADKMMAVRNDEAEFLRLSKEIDNIIATLYNLTEELNFIINNDTKCRMYDELNVHEYAEKK